MVEIGTLNGRKVFYQKFDNEVWHKDFPIENWLLFAIMDNRSKPELFEISEKLIDNNACYVCCTGEQRELLHDIIDEEVVIRGTEMGLPFADIMTTWHSDIENGLWFSVYAAYNDPAKINIILCLDGATNDSKAEITDLLRRFNEGYIPPDE